MDKFRKESAVAGAYFTYYEALCTNYVIQTPTGVLYMFCASDSGTHVYVKSTDYGITWGAPVVIKSAHTSTLISVWPDWWSGITATAYIHIAYTGGTNDDTFYRYLDTSTDTLGTERTVYAGSSTANGGSLSITRARGGNLICATCIDAGAEYDTVKSTDYFATQSSIAEVFEGATYDTVALAPNPDSSDNQDILCFYWDSSADEISLKKYDDSADSWSEASMATGMVDPVYAYRRNYCIGMDLTNSNVIFAAWSAWDTLNADLRIWSVDDSATTELTNVILNSTDDQTYVAVTVCPNNIWYVFYLGKSDGSEVAERNVNIYYKISTDQGSTWGSETNLTLRTLSAFYSNMYWHMMSPAYCYVPPVPLFYMRSQDESGTRPQWVASTVVNKIPVASFQLGM